MKDLVKLFATKIGVVIGPNISKVEGPQVKDFCVKIQNAFMAGNL